MDDTHSKIEKRKFLHSLVFPGFFLFLIWFIKFIEFVLETKFTTLGIYPLHLKGITGIITAPLVHADINHLTDNSIPLFLLSLAIFYFYREVAYKVFFLVYIISGLLVWIAGREAYHIGASGIVYGFAAFIFFSGVIRRNRNLMAISLLVTFLYGSMVWGVFPFDYKISWESHLLGAITGTGISWIFRHEGPEPDDAHLDDDEEEENTNIENKQNNEDASRKPGSNYFSNHT